MSEGETDDDDGHIVDEYGLEEETSLLQGSFNNHLSETRRARRVSLAYASHKPCMPVHNQHA